MTRPMAITGLAFLLAIFGVMMLIIALGAIPIVESGESLGGAGLFFLAMGVVSFVLAYGLFALKSWAWMLGIVVAIACFVLAGVLVLLKGTLGGVVLTAVPGIFILGGMFLPDVRKTLQAPKSETPQAASNPDKKPKNTGRRKR